MFRVVAFAPNGSIFDAEFPSQWIADCVEEHLLDSGYTIGVLN